MAKRKRSETIAAAAATKASSSSSSSKLDTSKPKSDSTSTPCPTPSPFTIQIVAGSYDRVLHGLTARIKPTPTSTSTAFADTFLFNAHNSAIRSVALSPPSLPIAGQGQKIFLASGSTDERINIYNLSAHEPKTQPTDASTDEKLLASLAPRPISENKKNREVGALMHHSSSVNALAFPTRGKLLSAGEDSVIGVTRVRDWQLLSTIKVPIPKAHGRPTGDTAVFGGQPAGVNDFAVHPSLKVMISVSRGEKAMRLWNLVTGKKAGVLNFGRDVLVQAGEGKHSSGEGRHVRWGSTTADGDEFAVAFERDVVVFGMDSTPKCIVLGSVRTKVHQIAYVRLDETQPADEAGDCLLAVSTEDGRVLFYSTRESDLTKSNSADSDSESDDEESSLPTARLVAQIGGRSAGVSSRIKDFKVLRCPDSSFAVVAGSSDGRIRVWRVPASELQMPPTVAAEEGKAGGAKRAKKDKKTNKLAATKEMAKPPTAPLVGELVGTYETQNRITCLEAFVMIPRPDGLEDSEDDEEESESEDEDEDEDE